MSSDESGAPGEEPRIDGRRVFDGRLLRVDVDRVRLPGGGEADREVARHPGAAAVVPLVDAAEGSPSVVLVRQFRYAAGEALWEIPAGTLEPGEEPEACARRELEEETGLRAGELDALTTIYTSPGFTDERIHLFVATDPERGVPHPEEDEKLQRRELPLETAVAMVERGEIRDGKTATALLLARGRAPGGGDGRRPSSASG